MSIPFTYQAYRSMLQTFAEHGYRFVAFPEVYQRATNGTPFILLRHDIDFDTHKALRLAEIEAGMGVTATYFFLVSTTHYNVFARQETAHITQILRLGHHLGLHFDCAAYDPKLTVHALRQACTREARLLQDWFGKPVEIVSYHRPNALVLTGNPELSAPRPHTYMPRFTRDIAYNSDSRGRWNSGLPTRSAAFAQRRPLHILVHPIWWSEQPIGPYDILAAFVASKQTAIADSVAQNCSVYRIDKV